MRSKADVLDVLKKCGALTEGHFVLASGNHSANYFQVAMLTQRPALLAELIAERLSAAAMPRPDAVVSPAIGAIAVGQQVALALDCRALYAERDADNHLVLKRNFALGRGEKIWLVEDVITTGGTLDELKALADLAGAATTGVFSVVNRSGRDTWQDLPIVSIIRHEFPVYPADSCPLCRDGVPSVRPGTKKVSEAKSQ